MHLIQILLPITVDDPDGGKTLGNVRDTLAERFGGVTLYRNAPAEGLWKDEGAMEVDTIVVAEVMTEHLDREWWAGYRREMERRFKQDEIVVRAFDMSRI